MPANTPQDPLITKIREFVMDPDTIQESLALLAVGINKDETLQRCFQTILASALYRFHKIPVKPGQS